VTGCDFSVSDSVGEISTHYYTVTTTAADGAFDETNESMTLKVDISLWRLGSHSMVIKALDFEHNLGDAAYVNITVVDRTAPASPTGLSVSNQSGNGTLLVSWNDMSDADLGGYALYRSYLSGRGYAPVANLTPGNTTFLDEGLINGVKYYYTVSALDNATPPNESPKSTEAWGTPSSTSADGGGDGNGTEDPNEDIGGASSLPYLAAAGVLIGSLATLVVWRRRRPKSQ
jgi:hypothetical protein